MNRQPDRRPGILRTALQIGLIGLMGAMPLASGCSKPPPPPPPPAPPPPPPPPPNIKLEDVSQELRVDARVQVAPGIEVGPDEGELARAILRFADSIAKGDAKAARELMTRRAQGILDSLESDGLWQSSTEKIEAVRIIAVQPGVSFGGIVDKAMNQGAINASELMKAALGNLPDDQKQQVQQMLGQMASDPAALQAQIDAALEQMKSAGLPPEMTKVMDEMKAQMAAALGSATASAATDAPVGDNTVGTGILFAIQDPAGAYLLGWQAEQAGDKWLFTNAPTSREVRPRASAWDGIGEGGFGEGPALAAADAAAAGGSATAGAGSGAPDAPTDAPAAPSEPSSPPPTKKNTPHGPITIPGG